MMVNRHKYFRWTRRTAWISFAYVILVPTMLGTAGYMTEVRLSLEIQVVLGLKANGWHRASGRCVESEGEISSRSFRWEGDGEEGRVYIWIEKNRQFLLSQIRAMEMKSKDICNWEMCTGCEFTVRIRL
jgi:hypothetical protein